MIKEIKFTPAYDKRPKKPGDPQYGIHGVTIWFYLKGELGAVQFSLYTNWQLPHVQAEFDAKPPHSQFPYMFHEPMPTDLGFHSPKPLYEGQTKMSDDCELLGGTCYYDGSSLNAIPVFDRLRAEGDSGVWAALGEYYTATFGELR